ncbi:MAG: lysylphosphatidylglycerol synthase transmembrane domain-containing protein [Myxococcota bacterium]
MKNALRLAIGLALSALFLWLAFRGVDLAEMWHYITNVHPGYVVAYVASLVLIQFCRVFRWGVLIRPFATISPGALFRISCVGLMLILILPLRLGEFARPYLLKKETGARMSSGLGSVVVERAMDGLLVTGLFFVTTFVLEARYETRYVVPSGLVVAARAALIFFSAVTVVIVAALLTQDRVPRLLRRIGDPISPKLTDRAVGILEAFVEGLRSLPSFRAVSSFVVYTLVYWLANGAGLYLFMRAFGWDVPLLAGYVLVCVLVIGIMIPAGPGMVGTFHAAIVLGLSIFAIGSTEAAAYATVLHAVNVIVICGFGLPFILARRGQVGEIVRASATEGVD